MRKASVLLLLVAICLVPAGLALLPGVDKMVAYGVIVVSTFGVMALASVFSIQILAFMQGETPSHLTGKVMSFAIGTSMCAQPVGQLMYGVLFQSLPNQTYLVVLGAAAAAGVIALLSKKTYEAF